jgi:hypothetical protein
MVKLSDLYGGGETGELLQARFDTTRVRRLIQRRNDIADHVDDQGNFVAKTIVRRKGKRYRKTHRWKVPYGIRYYMRKPIRRHQMILLHPWYVTWKSPKTGKRLRKNFTTLPGALHFITTRAQYVDPDASVVAKIGYDIPPKWRGRIPKPYKWCPCCLQPRKFYRLRPEEDFFAMVKVPSEDNRGNTHDARGKRIYDWTERRLPVLYCKFCGITNRNHNYRRSNQPWEVRKFKKGVTRAKKNHNSSTRLSSRTTRRVKRDRRTA